MRPFSEILKEVVSIPEEKLDEAIKLRTERGGSLSDILLGLKVVSLKDISKAYALQFRLPFIEKIEIDEIDIDLIENLDIVYAKKNQFVPFKQDEKEISIIIADPTNLECINDLNVFYGKRVVLSVSDPQSILESLNRAYDKGLYKAEEVIDDMGGEGTDFDQDLEEVQDLLDINDEAPIIRLVSSLLSQAIKDKASDIHVEPLEKELLVRLRKDGILTERIRMPKRFQNTIISRLKIMAELNIAEKRLPQDGRIRIKIAGKDVDIRVSTVPTSYGERVVLRILDKTSNVVQLSSIGFSDFDYENISNIIKRPNGIILVTGPTGSGKTTTLYSCLSQIMKPDINILTIEDPVEYQLDGVGQVQVNSKIDLTFAKGLRSFLRQDPDVIMVGEIRDLETAEIAVQASLTGHLVLSTIHTNDAPGTVTRLLDMGVEPFLLASSMSGVLAQRLVRTLCGECKRPYKPDEKEIRELDLDPEKEYEFFEPVGCENCSAGYTGRQGIFEVLTMTDELRSLIVKGASAGDLRKVAVSQGMTSLRSDGARKVIAGTTSSAEVFRVTAQE